jgi:DNA-binding GntR family transcriptional regulator
MAADDLVTERVYGLVKAQLFDGGFGLDERLDIGRLAQRFGVSTTPVREALTRLAAERLIAAEAKRGFYARLWRQDELRALYEWRGFLLERAVLDAPAFPPDAANADDLAPSRLDPDALHAWRVAAMCASIEAHANSEARIAGANADERLHRARSAEPYLMPAEAQRAALRAGLAAPGARARIRAVRIYHEARMAMAAAIRERAILAAVARRGAW